jgi:hypothetical protein
VKEKIEKLYDTICSTCNEKARLLGVAWDNNAPFEKVYVCKKCGRKREKVTKLDLDMISQIDQMRIPYWYPETQLRYNHTEFKEGPHNAAYLRVCDLFTRRNLIALSILFNEIESIENESLKAMMKFVFTSTLAQTTVMMPYVKETVGKICKG